MFTGVMVGLNGCLCLPPSASAGVHQRPSTCPPLLYVCNNAVQPLWCLLFFIFYFFVPRGNSRSEVAPAAGQYLLFIRC